jgi:hypothetical protein
MAKLIDFPISVSAGGFNEDDAIELTEKLNLGMSGGKFSDSELDFIESWGGEDIGGAGTFYSTQITAAYGIEIEPGNEPGQYSWPKLAAMLRQKKAALGLE